MYVTSIPGTDDPIIHQSLVSLNLWSDNGYLSQKPSLMRHGRYKQQLWNGAIWRVSWQRADWCCFCIKPHPKLRDFSAACESSSGLRCCFITLSPVNYLFHPDSNYTFTRQDLINVLFFKQKSRQDVIESIDTSIKMPGFLCGYISHCKDVRLKVTDTANRFVLHAVTLNLISVFHNFTVLFFFNNYI